MRCELENHYVPKCIRLTKGSESMTTTHLLQQFKVAIHNALASSPSTRAYMRARSEKQRFPVQQWLRDLNILHQRTAAKHRKLSRRANDWCRVSAVQGISPRFARRLGSRSGPGHDGGQCDGSATPSSGDICTSGSFSSWSDDIDSPSACLSQNEGQVVDLNGRLPVSGDSVERGCITGARCIPSALLRDAVCSSPNSSASSSCGVRTPSSYRVSNSSAGESSVPSPLRPASVRSREPERRDLLSADSFNQEKEDYHLSKVCPFFTDSTNEYAESFQKKLHKLNGRNSDSRFCIEEYLSKSEKHWFNRYREVRLGKSAPSSPAASVFKMRMSDSPPSNFSRGEQNGDEKTPNEFLLPKNYVPPGGLRRLLLRRIGDWPFYAILLGVVRISRRKHTDMIQTS